MTSAANQWRCAAGLLGLSGVVVGALAAHAVGDSLAAAAVERGSVYQLIHGVALLALAPMAGRAALLAKLGLALGTLLFAGSIYLKHLAGIDALGFLTPVGGTLLIVGWGFVVGAAAMTRDGTAG